VGKTGFRMPLDPLDCGNSGTTMRLLAGLLAGQNFDSILTGDESLQKRPMNRIIEPLRQMGANIASENGRAPLRIGAVDGLKGVYHESPVASAQVKSCILLAGALADGETVVRESVTTRDHTERMLRGFGADIQFEEANGSKAITISGTSSLTAQNARVPADISAAAFFLIGAACLPGSDLFISDVGINPTRNSVLELLKRCGAGIEITDERRSLDEPYANVRVKARDLALGPFLIDGADVAAMIDEIPILAILGTQIEGGLEIRDARELRVKETDRINAIVHNLRSMKANVDEFDDGFRVGRSQLFGAEVDSFGDHRIAMAFAIAGLLANGETSIDNPECADISFPRFFETVESVVQR
jgi:3-phosphoshikimate 1-carboxyvinyltransferase